MTLPPASPLLYRIPAVIARVFLLAWLAVIPVACQSGPESPAPDEPRADEAREANSPRSLLQERLSSREPEPEPEPGPVVDSPSSPAPPPRAEPEPEPVPVVTTPTEAPISTPDRDPEAILRAGRTKPAATQNRATLLLAELKKNPDAARKAFTELCLIEAEFIPDLLPLVESTDRTQLTNFKLYIPNPRFVDESKHGKQFLLSEVPGMGQMEVRDDEGWGRPLGYTKKSVGVARNRKAYRVEVDNFHGFSLGVVIRAALRNRMLLALKENRVGVLRYPKGIDHRRHLNSWWRAFYHSYKDQLSLKS